MSETVIKQTKRITKLLLKIIGVGFLLYLGSFIVVFALISALDGLNGF